VRRVRLITLDAPIELITITGNPGNTFQGFHVENENHECGIRHPFPPATNPILGSQPKPETGIVAGMTQNYDKGSRSPFQALQSFPNQAGTDAPALGIRKHGHGSQSHPRGMQFHILYGHGTEQDMTDKPALGNCDQGEQIAAGIPQDVYNLRLLLASKSRLVDAAEANPIFGSLLPYGEIHRNRL
jgi:hypothetical protein